MKSIRLLATSLLVAVCAGFSSCEDDEFGDNPTNIVDSEPSISDKIDELFAEYMDDYSNIQYRFCFKGERAVLSGLKDRHLWFSEYDAVTKQLKSEWTDIEETDTTLNIYKGPGEYEAVKLNYILPTFYKKTSVGDIVTLRLNGTYNQTIFTFNKQSRRTKLQSDSQKNVTAYDWYAESVFIGKCCYSNEGEIIYEAKEAPQFDNGKIDALLISYEEGMMCTGRYISKYNYKESKTVWSTYIEPPFDITSEVKIDYTLLDNSTNVLHFKCEVMLLGDIKKDFTFKINKENGKIITDEVKVLGISINEQSVNLQQGDIFQLTATVQPSNATNKKVIWSSSNDTVASVSQDGLVTANSVGEANITVTTEDGGFCTTAIVTVSKKLDNYTSLIIGEWKMTSGDAVATHVTYKNDGTFEYTSTEDSFYREVGKYKIEGNKIYEMFSDEDEWIISDILLLNSMTLSVQELEADGVTPSGKKFAYQRVE